MRRRRAFGVCAVLALAGAAAAVAAVGDPKLSGTVGPGFSITLRDAQGQAVTRLDNAGTYELEVDDRSEEHNFHLSGPGGVDVATGVEAVGRSTFRVALVDGRYTFLCDPHAVTMRGTFTVGSAPPPPPPPPSPPSPSTPAPSAPVGARLTLTVGPGFQIALRTAAGKLVTRLRPGAYTIVARDRSRVHNARLAGAGASRATGVGFVGTRTWRVVLRNGVLVIRCDPHRTTMRRTVRVA
jgi:plastocyanin